MDKTGKLRLMADKLRVHSIKSTSAAGSGHPTSCLSCAEIMSCLFFSELKSPDDFVLSKGHAAPILWAAYAETGLVPAEELMNLRKVTSVLEGHPTPLMPLVKIATGSLGQGLSAGAGMALAKKMVKEKENVYVLLGDGELSEGSVWEAANFASYCKLDNLVAIADINRLGQSQETMHGHDVQAYRKKFEAFGWESEIINGHSVRQILNAFENAGKSKKPFAIIAKTTKGKGVSFLEDKQGRHGKALDEKEKKKALEEIGDVKISIPVKLEFYKGKPTIRDFKTDNYKKGEMVATRDGFGNALVNLGKRNKNAVAIDGDVKNSTRLEKFFRQFPERSFQSFIAEQNMVGVALGLSKKGLVPFIATFSAFLTRAHDFIRMAAYSRANLNIVGSHCGVSIGQDGPSQMGLEDISLFLGMAESVILYPCDAVSAEKLVRRMAKYDGICYLRTTREKTPVLYKNSEEFPIGGLKVLRRSEKDKALVIGAGVTVHEALKAYEKLKKEKINIRVIDLYSIMPVNRKSLIKHARECKNVIVAEDHYAGGIGSVVSGIIGKISHLYVKAVPRSGKPGELLKKYGIDSSAIVKTVKNLTK